MANQMIALQARAPQTDVLGASIQRNAQMMNMMSQQRSAERQAAQAAQQMEIARAQEARAASKAGLETAKATLDNDALMYAKYRNMAPAVIEGGAPVYAQWLALLNEESPERAKMIADAMPPERFNRDAFILMMGTMDQRFDARYGKAITKELIGPGGEMYGANISGVPGASYAVPLPDISRPRSGATPPVAGAAMAPSAGVNARATRGSATTPDDLRAQGVDPRSIPLGNPLMKPMSDTGAPAPDLGAIVQTMMDTGVVSQSNLEAMRAAAGPGKDAQLAEILRSNNIRIMPDEQPAGGMRSAVYRPEEGAAGMTQVQYNPNDYEPVRVKSPMQSPLPGSAQVPLGRVGAQAGAETGGSERAKRLEKLRGEMPLAKSETQTLIDSIDERIRAIDEFLRSPYRRSIIGPIEGRIPKMLQTPTRADAQALYDTISSNAVLDKLIQDRQATETGASPQGIVSDRDLGVAATAATRLTQTGTEAQQEIEMQRLRDVLYRTRQRALDKYNSVYREVLSSAPELRLSAPDIPKSYAEALERSRRSKSTAKAPPRRTAGGANVSDW